MEELKAIRVQGMSRTLVITQAAIIAALYTVLTIFAASLNLPRPFQRSNSGKILRSTHHPTFL